MYHQPKTYCLIIILVLASTVSWAQFTISGNVYDSSKVIAVKDVLVKSTSGTSAMTDSTGHYEIAVLDQDSITFIYRNKPTAKFAVSQIANIASFDISLHIRVTEKFRTLKEVRVYAKNYKQDSIETRRQYATMFNYQKPGIKTGASDYGGAVGMDVDEFINIFRFKRNKRLRYMQNRMLEQEQEKYIDYRFNKTLVRRITKLEGTTLDNFMKEYRPDYEFTQNSSTVDFYQYILNASYEYKRTELEKGAVKTALPQ